MEGRRRYNAGTAPHDFDNLIAQLEATRWAATLTDREWHLAWISRELKVLLGTEDPEELGVGRHLIEAQLRDRWRRSITRESELEQILMQLPTMIDGTPGGRDALKRMLPKEAERLVDEIVASELPFVRSSTIEFVQGDLPPVPVRILDIRLGGPEERHGMLRLFGSDLPAHVLALVARGDEAMFERMARMLEPRQRAAAILFADLEGSGSLARRLPSEIYFDLIRDLTTSVDELVISRSGVVGKHAGDGVTAFFAVEDFGSPSATARQAIEAARAVGDLAEGVAARVPGGLNAKDLKFNVGLHWGDRVFMGQVVTGGRIEVTALGDEVNEAARLEQSARAGAILASKNLIERLEPDDGMALGLRPETITYRAIADLPEVPEKAIRDAGGIAVTDLALPDSPPPASPVNV